MDVATSGGSMTTGVILPSAATADHKAPGWWGMVAAIATEAALFGLLLFSYMYVSMFDHMHWQVDGPPELTLVIPNTVILLVSSVTVWRAERGIKSGSSGQLRAGLALTLILGIAFLVIQGIEYSKKSFGPSRDAYSSLFYTITGFHFAHVFVGLIMLATVLAWSFKGSITQQRHLSVTNAALYWHFVDAVWIVLFATLYLAPHLK
jgi:cytochrome c oxidase subunit I+III